MNVFGVPPFILYVRKTATATDLTCGLLHCELWQGGDTEAFWPPVQQNHGRLPVQENTDAYVISFFS